jgi:hypothetical protein
MAQQTAVNVVAIYAGHFEARLPYTPRYWT